MADASDNCTAVQNPSQRNDDRNFIDQSPPYGPDDLTWADSDGLGNACDTDDDSDGLSDAAEAVSPVCASAAGATDPLKWDTDGDRVIDKAECDLGSNPNDTLSKPVIPPAVDDPDNDKLTTAYEMSIGTNPNDIDSDDDKLQDGWEVKGYGSNPLVLDSDGDAVKDGCEAASINVDNVVNPGDQALLSSEIARVPPPEKLANIDLNKDGAINPGDQAWQNSFVSPPGQCP